MSPENQRIAIAEACGWRRAKHFEQILSTGEGETWDGWQSPDGEWYSEPLYYDSDLNAMHSAVASQAPEFRARFQDHLDGIAITRRCLICDLEAVDWAHSFLAILTQMAENKRHE